VVEVAWRASFKGPGDVEVEVCGKIPIYLFGPASCCGLNSSILLINMAHLSLEATTCAYIVLSSASSDSLTHLISISKESTLSIFERLSTSD